MALALARRYRPRRFADLLVQDHVAAVLRGAVSRGRVGHGYLLTGPRGVGKTTAARILAMALNCANRDPSGDPCGECENCLRIWNGNANLDVVEIDAASNRGVDDARELRERAMYAASTPGAYKVYIVDEAHMLTREAWNALLKILEEPPPGVVFVFATTEPLKIQQTAAPVLSRLQRFDFRRIGPAAIRERLAQVLRTEGIEFEDDALTLLARHADGGMRDGLSMLDQCLSFGEGIVTAARVRELLGLVDEVRYAELLRIVVERDAAAVFRLVDEIMAVGADPAAFVAGASEMLRALLMHHVGATPDDITDAMRELLDRNAPLLGAGDVLRMLTLLGDSENALRRSGNVRLAVETLFLRWALLERVVDLEAVLRGAPAPVPKPAAPRPSVPPRPAVDAETVRRSAPSAPSVRAPAERVAAPAAVSASAAADDAPTGSPVLSAMPFTAEALIANWSRVVDAAKAESRFLGEAVAHAAVASVQPPVLVLTMDDGNPAFAGALEKHGPALERLLAAATGQPVTLKVQSAAAPAAPRGKLTDESLRNDRLRSLRAKDPALDVAAEELDLEIVD